MRKTRETSPFAAAGTEARNAAWILWRAQHADDELIDAGAAGTFGREDSIPAAPPVGQNVCIRPPISHEQYDAVVRRMKNARKQTGAFSQWNA